MNIAEITTVGGGMDRHVSELIDGIQDNIFLVVGNVKEIRQQEENGRNYFHLKCLASIKGCYFINPLNSYNKLKGFIQKNNIELIHIHAPVYPFIFPVVKNMHIPKILTVHYLLTFNGNRFYSSFFQIFIQAYTKFMAKNVDKIILINKEYIPIFEKWGVEKSKLIYIPNGINTERFSPGHSEIKKKLQCKNLVVFWGRLDYQKNVSMLLEAFKKIKIENTVLVIIGKGEEEKQLKKHAGDNVIFTGYLNDAEMLEYIRDADIAVFPSRGESWGLVIGEAMACELPVITPEVGVVEELIGEERGIILKGNTSDYMAEAIQFLLKNKQNAKKMGKKARTFIVNNYSWELVKQRTMKVYSDVVKTQSKQPKMDIVISSLPEKQEF